MAKRQAKKQSKKQPKQSVWSQIKSLAVNVARAIGKLLWVVLWPLRPVLRPSGRYLRGVRQEFKRVAWPNRKLTWKLTFAVIGFSVVFTIFIVLIDYGLSYLFENAII